MNLPWHSREWMLFRRLKPSFVSSGNKVTRALTFMVLGLLFFACRSTYAIDNPDTSDRLNDFLIRAQTHEQNVLRAAHTTQSYAAAYASYERFLDKELNAAYAQLMLQLTGAAQQALKNSQTKWLVYRDMEFEFIAQNWTTENFGSASVISRGDYRARLVKDRTVLLLQYLQNYR